MSRAIERVSCPNKCSNRLNKTLVSYVKGVIWTNVHLGIAIICACLPTYRPLVTHWKFSLSGICWHSDSTSSARNALRRDNPHYMEREERLVAIPDSSSATRPSYCTGEEFVITFSPEEQTGVVQ